VIIEDLPQNFFQLIYFRSRLKLHLYYEPLEHCADAIFINLYHSTLFVPCL